MWDIWYFSCFSFKIQTNFQSNLFFRCCWTYIVTITWISMMEVAVKVTTCLQDSRNVHFTDFFLGKFWIKSVGFNFRFIFTHFRFSKQDETEICYCFCLLFQKARARFLHVQYVKRARFYKNTENFALIFRWDSIHFVLASFLRCIISIISCTTLHNLIILNFPVEFCSWFDGLLPNFVKKYWINVRSVIDMKNLTKKPNLGRNICSKIGPFWTIFCGFWLNSAAFWGIFMYAIGPTSLWKRTSMYNSPLLEFET